MLDVLPSLSYTMKVVVALLAGVVLLRLAGNRAISQQTVPETVLMIAIGTILIQPLASKSEWIAVYGAAILVVGMVVLSMLQVKFPGLRKMVLGMPLVVVQQGKIDPEKLKRAKMNQDELEMRVRQLQIGSFEDIKMAIIEPSGNLSVVLTESKRPAQKEDIQMLVAKLEKLEREMHALKRYQVNGYTFPVKEKWISHESVTEPVQDKLFEEALWEDEHGEHLIQ